LTNAENVSKIGKKKLKKEDYNSKQYTIWQQTIFKHDKATLPHIASGSYVGEHWLASFAVYMLSMTDL
jgi:hypothetical protein